MENLVKVNLEDGKVTATSLKIAEIFGKNHAHVLRDIQNLDCPNDFRESNFGLSSYISSQSKELPMYEITKDGFSFLVMGYTGEKAAEFKVKFINEFNKRGEMLQSDDYILIRSQQIMQNKSKALEATIVLPNVRTIKAVSSDFFTVLKSKPL
jgi:Rha family phage regulatory protein